MNLVVVESPAKAKTIEKYLGKDFKVLASFGHVRDLPTGDLGVDIEADFEPKYVIPTKAKKVISDLRAAESKAKILYLATDLDREGEAISWHILKALKIKEDDTKVKRIVFNEITKTALEKAVKNPRGLDMNLVDAQQARRVLDRLVGYKLSPFLWKKVKSGLSAGRVQSVAVRLIVEKEKEISAFKSEEYWLLGVNLSKQEEKNPFAAFLVEIDGKNIGKLDIKTKKQADEIEKNLDSAKYKVLDIEKKESLRTPSAPFTTSTLQMEASRKLGYSAKQTMMLAQKLYEAGHITYMRTDSVNISEEALKAIRNTIVKEYGEKYLPESAKKYKTKTKRAQEAHEAIRPSHFTEKQVSSDSREQSLFDLIWKRTIASQMKEAVMEVSTVKIEAKTKQTYIFVVKGEVIKFDGFIKVYTEGKDDEIEEDINLLPALTKGEELDFISLIKNQKFTEPPTRYSEATLVKKMESLGIGRPSTYAPTLTTIQDRGYVLLENRRFIPNEIGTIVSDLLVEHFPKVVDYQFTAKMEDEFDEIAEGTIKWQPMIKEFYEPFLKNLTEKTKEVVKDDIMKPEETDEKCPECGKPIVIRIGRFGKFMACTGFPECKFSKPVEEKDAPPAEIVNEKGKIEEVTEKEKCEKCGGKMIMKEGRFGKFLACENYPKCKNTKTIIQSSGMKCPDCKEGDVIQKRTKKGRMFWGCSRYPKCEYASWTDPTKPEKKEEGLVEKEEESGPETDHEQNEPQSEKEVTGTE